MNEVANLIAKAKVYFLATDVDGQPNVRPMGSFLHLNDRVYFVLAKNMNLFKELNYNNKISITAYDGTNILRLKATAILDDSSKTIETVGNMAPPLKKLDKIAPFYLKDCIATIGEFLKATKTYNF
ncbi:MAG: pyridoxamine 5'-phosphate oxidase family protein [Spirochaetaceae bacterium]|nr:pyridoxamine 5'-phosphate oxidase family protein [Spirochaetaceae bacterium]